MIRRALLGLCCLFGCLAAACSSSKSGDKPPPPPPKVVAPPDAAPGGDVMDTGALGALTFPISEGTPAARAHFTRGLLALHSFWYDEATREFHSAIAADPSMNMAYWGLAMSRCKLLWGEDDVAAAKKELGMMPDPDHLPPAEQVWIVAAVELLKADDVRTSRTQFAAAMQQLNAEFPSDESATWLALALLSTIRPEDRDTTAIRKRAAELALGVYKHNPKHPGAAHYLIHAYDTPELAPEALTYAREYATLAPAAFHARHMPAHIFSRLGMWPEAIASCRSAWDASVEAAKREKLSANHHDFHSLSWWIEMSFELGHRRDADAALKLFADAVRGGLGRSQRALYASQVASYLMRIGDWKRIDELLAPLEARAVDEPAPDAPRPGDPAAHCAPGAANGPLELAEQVAVLGARARAAAMLRDVAKTKALAAQLDGAREKLRSFYGATRSKDEVAKLYAGYARQRNALFARAAGDDKILLKLLRESESDPIADSNGESNPSGFVLREEIADALLRLGHPKQAVAEYAVVLKTHPRRARALLGLARAAKQSGDAEAATRSYRELIEVWNTADAGTDGLDEARAAIHM